MANLLQNPNAWKDMDNVTPPAYWNGAGWTFVYDGSGEQWRMTLVAGEPGDTVQGVVTGSGFDTPAWMNWVVGGVVLQSFPLDGVQRSIALDYAEGGALVVGSGAPDPQYLYAGSLAIAIPAPLPGNAPYVIGNYLRAYWGVDTPLSVWIRGEAGPLDLTNDVITVQLRWPWMVQADIPASGTADGEVAFTLTAALLQRWWGNDYGLRRATYRGQNTMIRVVSAQRGMLAQGFLEVA